MIAAAFFLLFIYVELRIARRPIMPLSLLQKRNSLCIGLIASLVAVVNFNMVYHLGMLFEIVFQQSVSLAGAHLLPNSVRRFTTEPGDLVLTMRMIVDLPDDLWPGSRIPHQANKPL
jgi:hypothetical protein